MSVLLPYMQGFLGALDEIEKTAAKPVKETRKGWLSPKSRKGVRPLKVSTMLKKEKDGTLGGYKLAELLTGFSKVAETLIPYEEGPSDQGAAQRKKEPGDIPSRDDIGSGRAKREDTRGFSATIHGPATIIAENAMTPGSR